MFTIGVVCLGSGRYWSRELRDHNTSRNKPVSIRKAKEGSFSFVMRTRHLIVQTDRVPVPINTGEFFYQSLISVYSTTKGVVGVVV